VWHGEFEGERTVVYAGYPRDDGSAGVIAVRQGETWSYFITASGTGDLTIEAVEGPTVTLVTNMGTRLTFDLTDMELSSPTPVAPIGTPVAVDTIAPPDFKHPVAFVH
jgi:hypothetical protein